MASSHLNKTQMVVHVFNKYAQLYQEKFMDLDLYHNTFDFFCESIEKQNAAVLEIGCGPGNITKYLLRKRPEFKVTGIDIAQNMLDLAQKNNPEAEFQLLDARKIGNLKQKFDALMCGFCLPYLSKEETQQLLSDASELLYSGGMLYLSTMEGDYSQSGLKKSSSGADQTFTHYYSESDLKRLLTESNFKLTAIFRKDYPQADGTNTVDLIVIAVKN